MKPMLAVLRREFSGYFSTPVAYVFIVVFLFTAGIFTFYLGQFFERGQADLKAFFLFHPWLYLFFLPAIAMRLWAEERKAGTMELLLTKPLSDTDILLGKFLASFLLVLVALLPTLIYYWSIRQLGNPVGNIDTPGVIGSYIGLALLGAVFCAVGILASSITPNQIVSFITAAFLCFILFTGFDSISTLPALSAQALSIQQWGMLYHYRSVSRGLIDSRDVIYFLSVTGLLLLVTRTILGSRSW